MNNTISRIDLHVHTFHSRTAGNWILDQLQMYECYTEPMDVYKIATSRGMDFVTITDHDVISGALEIAHMPNFFISEEVSAFFPHDKAKVHILVFNINEAQHDDIQRLRFNIYDLIPYLNQQNIVHALAHPFFEMGPRLTIDHIEQMLLMFKIFEVKNGGKNIYPEDLFEQICTHLTPEKIWKLADRHNRNPIGEEPWKKSFIGGSDDHGGIMISSPHTVTDKAHTVDEILAHITAGKSRTEGGGGSPLSVAHGALAVGYKYSKTKKKSFDLFKNQLAWLLLDNVFEETKTHGLYSLGLAYTKDKIKRTFSLTTKKGSKAVQKEIARYVKKDKILLEFLMGRAPFDHDTGIRFFNMANDIVNHHLITILNDAQKHNSPMRLLKNCAILKNILPLTVPYLVGFKTETADRKLMRECAEQFLPKSLQIPHKVAIFSDSSPGQLLERDEMNDLLHDELAQGYRTVYFTVADNNSQKGDFFGYKSLIVLKNSPHYGLPPAMRIAYDFFQEACDIIFIDTLGPMGILGMLIGKLLQIPIISTYHETEVNALAKSGGETSKFFKKFISVFYSQVDEVRLLDMPSTMEYEILAKSKTDVRILGNTILIDAPEFQIYPETEIY
ncbi:hypothetical protein JXA02_04060 [candidate division KSB1 bacterium]|nr:hypothetical protein [candidate division KSB1 bacterium]RQW09103.1 MAG: hypothetical protein EH222_04545 [candidate division KSB1 bacterium]